MMYRRFVVLLLLGLLSPLCRSAGAGAGAGKEGTEVSEESKAVAMLQGIQSLDPSSLTSQAQASAQERIDTILRAFHRLPGAELARLEVDLERPIVQGSREAELLFEAWGRRQLELKAAMANVLKPAEFMGDLARQLNATHPHTPTHTQAVGEAGAGVGTEAGEAAAGTAEAETPQPGSLRLPPSERILTLHRLEGLLDDVDNARDFHTIGAWPTLVRFLGPEQPSSVRAAAAWAVGSAVKSTYDYQLWTLEGGEVIPPSPSSSPFPSCLELLVRMLRVETSAADAAAAASQGTGDSGPAHDDLRTMQRRALYALSASMRGNLDVQDAILLDTKSARKGAGVEVEVGVGTGVGAGDEGGYEANQFLHSLFLLASELSAPDAAVGTAGSATASASPSASPSASAPSLPDLQLLRKVWSHAADLLEERSFIRHELDLEIEAEGERREREKERERRAQVEGGAEMGEAVMEGVEAQGAEAQGTETGAETGGLTDHERAIEAARAAHAAARAQRQISQDPESLKGLEEVEEVEEVAGPSEAVLAVQNMRLLGDLLLHPHWLGAAAAVADRLAWELTQAEMEMGVRVGVAVRGSWESRGEGDEDDEGDGDEGSESGANTVVQHAALRSVFTFAAEAVLAAPQLLSHPTPTPTTSTPPASPSTPATPSALLLRAARAAVVLGQGGRGARYQQLAEDGARLLLLLQS